MVSFAVTGHPLEDTWGAISSSDVFWSANDDPLPVLRQPWLVCRQFSMVSVLFLNLTPAVSPWFTCSRLSRPRATGFSLTLVEATVFLSHFVSTRMVSGCTITTPSSATASPCRRLNQVPSAYSDSGWRVWQRSCAQAAIVGLRDRVNATIIRDGSGVRTNCISVTRTTLSTEKDRPGERMRWQSALSARIDQNAGLPASEKQRVPLPALSDRRRGPSLDRAIRARLPATIARPSRTGRHPR